MCDENDNEQEGKVMPSMLDLHGRASEEHPEAKENLDSPAKVIVEPLKPFENGHHLPAADVPAAVDEAECSRVDTPMPSSTNVDVIDSQQWSVDHNCESSEASAPLDSGPDVTACKDMNISDNHKAPVEPTRENVQTSNPFYTENVAIADENVEVLDNLIRSVEPICVSFEGSAEPIRKSVEGSKESIHESVEGSVGTIDQCVEVSVEPSHESVEPFMDPIYESVEATISVERKDEDSVDENGGTTELAWQESEVNDSNLAATHLQYGEPVVLAKLENVEINENKSGDAEDNQQPAVQEEFASHVSSCDAYLENKIVEPTKIDALTEKMETQVPSICFWMKMMKAVCLEQKSSNLSS